MNIFKNKFLVIILSLIGVVIILSAVLTASNINKLSTPLILHFDDNKNVDLFGKLTDLWQMIIMAVIMIIANTILAELLFYREKFLSYLLSITSLMVAIINLIAIGVILSFN